MMAFGYLRTKLYDARLRLERERRLRKVPQVLVYTQGRVGSRSLWNALRVAGFDPWHVHYLHPAYTERAYCWETGLQPDHRKARLLYRRLILSRRAVRIVTAVRDPVARNLSAYWRTLGNAGLTLTPSTEQFLADYPHDVALNWWRDELESVTSIDAVGECGRVLRRGPLALVVVKSEWCDARKAQAMAALLKRDMALPCWDNQGAKLPDGYRYRDWIATLRLPSTYLDRMYAHPVTRAFYNQDEIQRFRQRWSEGGHRETE